MRLKSLALLIALVAIPYTAALAEAPATFRLDYFHTGNATQELFSVDRTVMEPLAWPGNPQKSIDDTNRGVYFY
ncbi:MAG TPA: peptidase M64 N-terminal domain-containing protein, partial [Bryobacteraceae bacterium]|nr:peptidase M64 N-terminal domain-containing protein [Bryobacteraceae bacterium]